MTESELERRNRRTHPWAYMTMDGLSDDGEEIEFDATDLRTDFRIEQRLRPVPHLTVRTLGVRMENQTEPGTEEWEETEREKANVYRALNAYLHHFTLLQLTQKTSFFTGGNHCPNCISPLGGMLGTFTYGIVHGEGRCGRCGYPCRTRHVVTDPDTGEELLEMKPPDPALPPR